MVITGLDHGKEVEGIGAVLGPFGQAVGVVVNDPGFGDLGQAPIGDSGKRRIDHVDNGGDLGFRQNLGEARHLGRRAAFGDDTAGLAGFETAQVLGD